MFRTFTPAQDHLRKGYVTCDFKKIRHAWTTKSQNYLGTSPLVSTPALTAVSSDGQSITFRHSRSNLAAVNLISSYQWSPDLTTWLASGQQAGEATVTIATSLLSNTDAPANDLIEVTATVTGGTLEKLYLRLRVTKP
jgi:hypothetical protein